MIMQVRPAAQSPDAGGPRVVNGDIPNDVHVNQKLFGATQCGVSGMFGAVQCSVMAGGK